MVTLRRPWRRAWSRGKVLALVLGVLLSPPFAQAYVKPPIPSMEMHRPKHDALHHRRCALQHIAGMASGLLLWGGVAPSAWAADSSGGRKGLVNLLRVRAYIVTLKETLQELLDNGEKSAPAEINQQIKYLVRTIRMAESIHEAAMLVEGGDRARDAARTAGRASYEYLTQVIEFSGFEDMKRDGVSKYATLSSPERIQFALKCLAAADLGIWREWHDWEKGILGWAAEALYTLTSYQYAQSCFEQDECRHSSYDKDRVMLFMYITFPESHQ